jgi:hypothetical protein
MTLHMYMWYSSWKRASELVQNHKRGNEMSILPLILLLTPTSLALKSNFSQCAVQQQMTTILFSIQWGNNGLVMVWWLRNLDTKVVSYSCLDINTSSNKCLKSIENTHRIDSERVISGSVEKINAAIILGVSDRDATVHLDWTRVICQLHPGREDLEHRARLVKAPLLPNWGLVTTLSIPHRRQTSY